jgi:hypothetical protein
LARHELSQTLESQCPRTFDIYRAPIYIYLGRRFPPGVGASRTLKRQCHVYIYMYTHTHTHTHTHTRTHTHTHTHTYIHIERVTNAEKIVP